MSIDISIVIIGRNERERVERCIRSVEKLEVTGFTTEQIYVDSASKDDSVAVAQSLGACVVEPASARPTAALARNAGWRLARGEYILFLDCDTIVDPNFLAAAVPVFTDPAVAIVWSHRRELNPTDSFFNRVIDLERIYPAGPTEFCGGDALVRKSVLEEVSGFDELLIAGKEPEMCRRIKSAGYEIVHIDVPMTVHDLAMRNWAQYWNRALRAGYAYAEVSARFRNTAQPLWHRESVDNCVRALFLTFTVLTCTAASILLEKSWPIFLLVVVLSILVLRTAVHARWKSRSWTTLVLYGIHSHVQQVPIFVGQLHYFHDCYSDEKRGLIEYKEVQS